MSAENAANSCDANEKFGTLFKRPRLPSRKYADLNFSLLKKGYKYSAFCHVCKKSIKNTATVRLQTHRKVCQPCTPFKRNEKLVRKTTTKDPQKPQEKVDFIKIFELKKGLYILAFFRYSLHMTYEYKSKMQLQIVCYNTIQW